MTAIDDLLADFEILDDWEDRYRHVIELGRELAPLPEGDHTAENKVKGCASQVWITSQAGGPKDDPVITFQGDSDALIVKGLVAIAFMIYSGKTARQILATDAGEVLGALASWLLGFTPHEHIVGKEPGRRLHPANSPCPYAKHARQCSSGP